MFTALISATAAAAVYRGVLHVTSAAKPDTMPGKVYVILGGGGPRPVIPK